MPGAGLIALLDDITSVLDDVSLLTKVAAKKTAGVLGDDLALNAEQVAGVQAARELPVVWAVAKGSMVNKAILVPSALEQEKIKGAIRTDFVLSAEIVTIALGTVAASDFLTRATVLCGISVLM